MQLPNIFKANVKTPATPTTATTANPAQAKLNVAQGATDTLGEKKPAGAVKNAGLKLVAKIVGGTIAAGGLGAFAIYGMIAAAPHIGALFGVIAAAPATVPILATIGAVLGTVAIVLVIRAIYKKVQQEQVRTANNEAVKREAAAFTGAQTPATPVTPQSPVVNSPAPESVAGASLSRSPSAASLTPSEADVLKAVENNTPERNEQLLAEAQTAIAGFDTFFDSITTERESGTPEQKQQIADAERGYRQAVITRDALASDAAVAI